jgi:hypothetical protein
VFLKVRILTLKPEDIKHSRYTFFFICVRLHVQTSCNGNLLYETMKPAENVLIVSKICYYNFKTYLAIRSTASYFCAYNRAGREPVILNVDSKSCPKCKMEMHILKIAHRISFFTKQSGTK